MSLSCLKTGISFLDGVLKTSIKNSDIDLDLDLGNSRCIKEIHLEIDGHKVVPNDAPQ